LTCGKEVDPMNRPWLLPVIACLFLLFSPSADLQADGSAASRVRLIDPGRVLDVPKVRVYLQAKDIDEEEVIALRERLIAEGAERVNLFASSKIIVCEAPKTMDLRVLIADPRVVVLEEPVVDRAAGASPAVAEDLGFVRMCYERALVSPQQQAITAPLNAGEGFDDVLRIVPPDVVEESKARVRAKSGPSAAPGAVVERNIQQNSEFLCGTVLIQLVFPESNGNGEDWTDRMIADATSGAYAAALAFQAKFAYTPMHFTFKTERGIPTTYEPITTTMGQHEEWIHELMTFLEVREEKAVELMVHEYNNTWREYYRTDWVFTAFIANSANDGDHRFADQFYTAYAMLGGPYLVIPHPAGENPFVIDPWLVFSTVFQHEMSHVFWALDEYPGQNNISDCLSHSGYLDYLNKNRVEELEPGVYTGCPGVQTQLCIMWRAKEELGRPVCIYTQGQIGVVDNNRNSVPDVFEAAPTVAFEGTGVETVLASDVTVRFKVISKAVPNDNPFQGLEDRINYAPALKDAKVSVDGFGSFFVDPVDGKWDEIEEDVSVSLRGLSAGLSKVGVVARNAFGKASATVYKSIYYLGIKFALFDVAADNDGTRNVIEVSWKTVGETFGATFDLYRVDASSGLPDTTCLAVNLEGRPDPAGVFRSFSFVDASVTAGRSYRFFVKGSFDIERDGVKTHYEVTSDAFEAQSVFPIRVGQMASQATPNPFRDRTWVSVRIPDTMEDVGGQSASGVFQLVRTPLSITVFDVAGRVVKRIYNGYLYGGVKTFEWDGTNENNERVRSGVYFVRTEAGPGSDVKKVVVVR
jgi:hypothetical protein